jgi:hypothetical protein
LPRTVEKQLPIVSRRGHEWAFWRAEARSGKGELLPILLDNASQGLTLARMAADGRSGGKQSGAAEVEGR